MASGAGNRSFASVVTSGGKEGLKSGLTWVSRWYVLGGRRLVAKEGGKVRVVLTRGQAKER